MKNKAELKKAIVKSVKLLIARHTRWLNEAEKSKVLVNFVNILPIFPEEFEFNSLDNTSITLNFRYDKFLIAKLKKLMFEKGFQIEYECKESDITNSYSSPYIRFQKQKSTGLYRKLSICLEFDEDMSGSTCVRKQIGTAMREVPIYEWNCEEKDEKNS